jgi:hypothetical protein
MTPYLHGCLSQQVQRPPGRPEPSHAVRRDFWRQIAFGVTTVEAAEAVGV